MTKVHEEYIRGTAEEVLARLSGRNETKGEFSVFISGNYPVLSVNKTGGTADN